MLQKQVKPCGRVNLSQNALWRINANDLAEHMRYNILPGLDTPCMRNQGVIWYLNPRRFQLCDFYADTGDK